MYTLVDVFAGAGGLTRGFVLTRKFRPVAAVEKEPDAQKTYEKNFRVKPYGLIETLRPEDIPCGVDVLIGGPPCQDFTQLTTVRKNATKERNQLLWHWYIELVLAKRPKVFLIENVPNLLTDADYEPQRQDLREKLEGYEIAWGILNASAFGVPQTRQRAFVIGVDSRQLEGVRPYLPVPPLKVSSVWDAIGALDQRPPEEQTKTKGYLRGRDLHVGRKAEVLSRLRYRYILPNGNRHHMPTPITIKSWAEKDSGHGDGFGRLRADVPGCTIRCEAFKPEKGRYLHPYLDRPLTLAEMAKLQTFGTHKFYGSFTSTARQIGNAVPPLLARYLGETIAALLAGSQLHIGEEKVPEEIMKKKDPKQRILALLKASAGQSVPWYLIEQAACAGGQITDWSSLLLRLLEEGYEIQADTASGGYTLTSLRKLAPELRPGPKRLIEHVKQRRDYRCDTCGKACSTTDLIGSFNHALKLGGRLTADNVSILCLPCSESSSESAPLTPGEHRLYAWLRGYRFDRRIATAIGQIVGVEADSVPPGRAQGEFGPPDVSRCYLCAGADDLTVTEIRPGGTPCPENLWALCRKCSADLQLERIKVPSPVNPNGREVNLIDRFNSPDFLTPHEAYYRNWVLVHSKDRLIADRTRNVLTTGDWNP